MGVLYIGLSLPWSKRYANTKHPYPKSIM